MVGGGLVEITKLVVAPCWSGLGDSPHHARGHGGHDEAPGCSGGGPQGEGSEAQAPRSVCAVELFSEVLGLHDTLTALQEKLELCRQTRAQLVSARARLLQDIRTKELSVNIDSGKCMTARIEYPHNQR